VCVYVCVLVQQHQESNIPKNTHTKQNNHHNATHNHTHTNNQNQTHKHSNNNNNNTNIYISWLITCYKHGSYTPAIFTITEATVIPVNILWYLRMLRTYLPQTLTQQHTNTFRFWETAWMFLRMMSYIVLRPFMAPFLVWYAAKHFGDRVGMSLSSPVLHSLYSVMLSTSLFFFKGVC